jgi:hypothetical protein
MIRPLQEPRPDGETQPDYVQDDRHAENERVERPKVETDSGQRHVRKDHQNDSDEERDPVRDTYQQRFRPAVGRCLTSRRDPITNHASHRNHIKLVRDRSKGAHLLSAGHLMFVNAGRFLSRGCGSQRGVAAITEELGRIHNVTSILIQQAADQNDESNEPASFERSLADKTSRCGRSKSGF